MGLLKRLERGVPGPREIGQAVGSEIAAGLRPTAYQWLDSTLKAQVKAECAKRSKTKEERDVMFAVAFEVVSARALEMRNAYLEEQGAKRAYQRPRFNG